MQSSQSPALIEALLLQHPDVIEATVIAPGDGCDGEFLEAYVVANLGNLKAGNPGNPRLSDTGLVGRWNTLYEITYSQGPESPSFVGWASSYTRQPIPEAQMSEWLQTTVARIRALQPERLLEIGCGVGLLLQHLAPQCSHYVGTDFSAAALSRLRSWLGQRADLAHVELLHRAATQLEELPARHFDTVVLNSVVQYFPNIEYLLMVLDGIRRLLRPGGRIFIGDVRNLQLLSTFHSAVQLSRAAGSVNAGQLKRRAARAVSQETELALDPGFFKALSACFPDITAADVQLRRGAAQNELTRYRYDVVLHTGNRYCDLAASSPIAWHTEVGCPTDIQQALITRQWPAAHLTGIRNHRLATDAAARDLIHASNEHETADALRERLDQLEIEGVDPEKLWQLADAHGYATRVDWDSGNDPGCFEVRLLDRGLSERMPLSRCLPPEEARPWTEYANNPLENTIAQQLIPKLREYLKDKVPASMIPPAWTVVRK